MIVVKGFGVVKSVFILRCHGELPFDVLVNGVCLGIFRTDAAARSWLVRFLRDGATVDDALRPGSRG